MLAFDFVTPPYIAQVIGVVENMRHHSLSLPGNAEAYFPYEQTPQARFSLVMSGPANSPFEPNGRETPDQTPAGLRRR